MAQYQANGKTYKEVMDDAKQYLEQPPMTVLPGGTWCPFCGTEICRTIKHSNRQSLLLLIAKMAKQIEKLNEVDLSR